MSLPESELCSQAPGQGTGTICLEWLSPGLRARDPGEETCCGPAGISLLTPHLSPPSREEHLAHSFQLSEDMMKTAATGSRPCPPSRGAPPGPPPRCSRPPTPGPPPRCSQSGQQGLALGLSWEPRSNPQRLRVEGRLSPALSCERSRADRGA